MLPGSWCKQCFGSVDVKLCHQTERQCWMCPKLLIVMFKDNVLKSCLWTIFAFDKVREGYGKINTVIMVLFAVDVVNAISKMNCLGDIPETAR